MEEAIEMDFIVIVPGIFKWNYIQRMYNAMGGPSYTGK